MNNLLTSGFRRLFKNKIFYATVIFSFLEAIFMYCNEINKSYLAKYINFDDLLINNLTTIGIPIAFFITFFVGIDYANGTIRNKIIVGHSRKNIYLSNLIISVIGSFIIELAYIIPVAILGNRYLKGIEINNTQLLLVLLDTFMMIVLLASIYNLASMLISDITVSSVFSIILTIIMIIYGGITYYKSIENKYIEEVTIVNGELHSENILDTSYKETPTQKMYEIMTKIMPKGQANILSAFMPNAIDGYRIDHDIRFLSLYSLGSTIILNIIGVYFFKKKNIK